MSKGVLSDLKLQAEPDVDLKPVQASEMPEERGEYKSYQPGHFVLRLPTDVSALYVKETKKIYGEDGKPAKDAEGKELTKDRIAMAFDEKDVLEIVNSEHGQYNGEALNTRISGAERARGKDGPKLSAIQYLLRALGDVVIPPPTDFAGTVKAITQHAGKVFEADWEWSGRCRGDKQAYYLDPETKVPYPGVDPANNAPILGCGEGSVYQSKWPTHTETREINGEQVTVKVYDDRTTCPECQALIYPFGALVRFTAHK